MAEYEIMGTVDINCDETRPYINDDGVLVVPRKYEWDSTGMMLRRAYNMMNEMRVEYGEKNAMKLVQHDGHRPSVTGFLSTDEERDGMQSCYPYYHRGFDDLDTAFEAFYALRESFIFIAPIAHDESVLLEGNELPSSGNIEELVELRDRAKDDDDDGGLVGDGEGGSLLR
jgi:hypothetical protein